MRYDNHKDKLFASAKEIAYGKAEIILEFITGATITSADIRERMFKKLPKLAQTSFVFAINHKNSFESVANSATASATTTTTITPYDEIALLSPISGG